MPGTRLPCPRCHGQGTVRYVVPLSRQDLDGYRPLTEADPRYPLFADDRAAAARGPCPACDFAGPLAWRPFVRGRRYRPFSVCPRCDHATEF